MVSKLLKIFGNYTRALEILYLLNNIKKSVRLDANEIELEKIAKFCKEENLCMEISDFKVIKAVDKGKGNYANTAKKVSINYPYNGFYHIYISKNKSVAKMLKLVENKNDDNAIGQLLGYPKCCIDFFVENREKQQKIQNDYILEALSNSYGFSFPFYTNYAIRYFDFALLSHFPHSFNCEASIKIAKANFECLKQASESIAIRFEKMLKSAVLYTENSGIFLFQDYKMENNIFKFGKFLSTSTAIMDEMLTENKKIEVISKNKVRIKDKFFTDVGFMVFT
ncbi:DUF483 domain-containing protein [Candidatus Woesearchaeota archaeon]|nr:DUF483 domain-containing protein [Candidatus Woesearchaeota archaeon]